MVKEADIVVLDPCNKKALGTTMAKLSSEKDEGIIRKHKINCIANMDIRHFL